MKTALKELQRYMLNFMAGNFSNAQTREALTLTVAILDDVINRIDQLERELDKVRGSK